MCQQFQTVDTLAPTKVDTATVFSSSSFRVTMKLNSDSLNFFHANQQFSNLFISISETTPFSSRVRTLFWCERQQTSRYTIHHCRQTVFPHRFNFCKHSNSAKKLKKWWKKSTHAISRNTNVRLICWHVCSAADVSPLSFRKLPSVRTASTIEGYWICNIKRWWKNMKKLQIWILFFWKIY